MMIIMKIPNIYVFALAVFELPCRDAFFFVPFFGTRGMNSARRSRGVSVVRRLKTRALQCIHWRLVNL